MTENPVESFHRGRETIMHSLVQIQALRNNYREARKITGECREKVYYYLGKQDGQFYAKITDFFCDNRPALKIVEFLVQDLKELKGKTFGFFEKYGVQNPFEQGRNFARDLREYQQALLERFRVEEDYLLPLLKRLAEENGSWLARK